MEDVLTGVGRRAWRQMGGEVADLRLVGAAQPPLSLPSRLDVAGLLGDCVSLATLALHVVRAARGRQPTSPVRVHGGRVATSARSERHFRLDGVAPLVWAPLSGFFQASDGWVRTHANYPHHAARLAALLGLGSEPSPEQVAAAVARRPARDLEDAAAEAGAVVGAVRTASQWAKHPQASAVARLPLVSVEELEGTAPPRPWGVAGPGPLTGVRVLDLTRVLAGPVATRNLALAGAEVLRVDSPHLPEIGWVHLDTGAGKRSATLDLRTAPGRRTFESLLEEADVVVTGYRPGSLDRFGLSPEELAARRPGLVVGSVSAWGTEGPWGQRRGFDSIVQAVTGIAMAESPDGIRPGALPAQALDHSAGHLLTAALCTALVAQRQHGGSRSVQVALVALARELLRTHGPAGGSPKADAEEPTLQLSHGPAGLVTCAAPPLTFDGAPATYRTPAHPWGTDEPCWTRAGIGATHDG